MRRRALPASGDAIYIVQPTINATTSYAYHAPDATETSATHSNCVRTVQCGVRERYVWVDVRAGPVEYGECGRADDHACDACVCS
jgi:hypothetical protein